MLLLLYFSYFCCLERLASPVRTLSSTFSSSKSVLTQAFSKSCSLLFSACLNCFLAAALEGSRVLLRSTMAAPLSPRPATHCLSILLSTPLLILLTLLRSLSPSSIPSYSPTFSSTTHCLSIILYSSPPSQITCTSLSNFAQYDKIPNESVFKEYYKSQQDAFLWCA